MSDDICQLVASLDAIGVRFIGARQESHAVMAATGYAAACGKLGVALIGRGPALANGVHGAVSASRTGMPVLIISGEAPVMRGATHLMGPDLKAFPAVNVLRDMGIATFVPASAESALQTLADAFAEASLGHTAALLLPMDVQLETVDTPTLPSPLTLPEGPEPQPARRQSVDTAIATIKNARRPLIVGGIGVHRGGAREAVDALAERIGALCVTTVKAKDLFRGSPWDLGIIGSSSHSLARRYIEQCDCVIAIGAALNSLTMSSGTALPPVPLIHIDAVRTHIGRWSPADIAVVGDARLTAQQLVAGLPDRAAAEKPFHADEVRERISNFEHTMDFQTQHTAHTLDQRVVALELSRMLPENRHVVFDGGNFMANWAYITVPDPGHFTHTSDSGSVGLGLGTAVGIKRARPDRTVVLLIGDGGLLMTLGEIETIIREDLPVVVICMNDAAYGAEAHILKGQNMSPAMATFFDVDFAPMVEPLGFDAHTVRTMDDLHQLAPLLAKPEGPVFIDVKVNVDVIAPFITEFTHKEN
ncbi:thiamine pyrophosphate-binding protein [Elongatibacter sediminis]|uniref:Thiamine pyrophosphate-binding protein n=1 Tax=Elongatibacter sediminis TaxID=3119006 RepID=A0AAW9R4X8_9GAMM